MYCKSKNKSAILQYNKMFRLIDVFKSLVIDFYK